MPIYEFKCPECRETYQSFRSIGNTYAPFCPMCKIKMKRKFSGFGLHLYPSGHNAQLGMEINSHGQHKAELRRMSEQAEERTGIPHDYQPVHPSEAKEAYGITDEGLDATYRHETAIGKREKQLWL